MFWMALVEGQIRHRLAKNVVVGGALSPPRMVLLEDQASKEHLVDALARRGDERRGTLRKATGRREHPLIRRFLNGETHLRD